jgi:hypothetical protein
MVGDPEILGRARRTRRAAYQKMAAGVRRVAGHEGIIVII